MVHIILKHDFPKTVIFRFFRHFPSLKNPRVFPRPQVFGSPGEVDCPPGAVPLSDQDQCEAAAKALSKDAEGAAAEG